MANISHNDIDRAGVPLDAAPGRHERPGARRPIRYRRTLLWVLIILVLGSVLASVGAPKTAKPVRVAGGLLIGAPVPTFQLQTLSGGVVSLSALRGHPVLLNFWASWCPPCRAEFPLLHGAQVAQGPKGLHVVGVLVNDSPAHARAFMTAHGGIWPVGLDPNNSVAGAYGIGALPESFFIRSNGTLAAANLGELNPTTLRHDLSLIMAR